MKTKRNIGICAGIVLLLVIANVIARFVVVRIDLTDDQRYTLNPATKELLRSLDAPMEISILLNGKLNPSFNRLKRATYDMVSELKNYADIKVTDPNEKQYEKLNPTVVHERANGGQTIQTKVYPYAVIRYKGRNVPLELLHQNRGKSGEENLNVSIESLEYTFAEAIHTIQKNNAESIAFLEGHGELGERDVYDWSLALSKYFRIDRGVLGHEAGILDKYRCVIIADPQKPFSDGDKYILDQYLMRGGRIMWLINGVTFSSNMLSNEGVTPVIPADLNLTDMLFRYGVRINPMLVQDLQCLRIPVDVSADPTQPNLQPIPWTYAPLLLTSETSPVTRNVMQVSTSLASCVDAVGEDDGIQKNVLLATSSASALTGAPSEIDLSDLTVHTENFGYQFVPVALSLEGVFTSIFAHRMKPDDITNREPIIKNSTETKQIVVASGNIARTEWYQGQPLPTGFDRYSQTQFGNRDFLTNAILFLTDDKGLIQLRQKSVSLRLLNDKKAHQYRINIQLVSIITPILLLGLIGSCVFITRKKLYLR